MNSEEEENTAETYEEIRRKNVEEREKIMTELGLGNLQKSECHPANRKIPQREKRNIDSSSEDDDEEWRPKKFSCSSEAEDLSMDEDWEERQGSASRRKPMHVSSTESNDSETQPGVSRYPRRTVFYPQNYKETGFPDSDEIIRCFECERDHIGDCPEHGALVIIEDTPIPPDINDEFRAKKTAPPMISVNISKIPEAGNGVWAREAIPARTRFGPYDGKIVPADVFTPYAWVIRKDGTPDHCVDATEPGLSNWMRYVNCARHSSEQNVHAYQYQGKIYYQTMRPIKSHEELLVWYGDDYSESLGIDPNNPEKNKESKFECPACPYAFSTALYLERHIKYCRHHQMDPSLVVYPESQTSDVDEPCVEPENEFNAETGDEAYKQYKCETCSVWFFNEESFRMHCGTHTPSDPTTFDCPKCERQFVKEFHLASHLRIKHSEDTPFKCDDCAKSFLRKNDLKMHIRTHAEKDFFKCCHCDKKFLLEENYKKHLSTHGKGQLECPKCGKNFKQKSRYDTHVETHSDENSVSCPVCNKHLTHKRHLMTHLRTHSGEQPFQCEECHKRFSLRENYMRHMRSHNGDKPFACEKCGKRFAIKGNLQNHFWTHSDEKPHVCSVCSKQFAERNTLTRHLRTHNGDKPYVCSDCNKRFARRDHLKLHLQTHIGKDNVVLTDRGENIP